MIQPIALAATHMECRNLQESMAVMTELLAFEKISEKPGEATLKHPNSPWVLILHEAGADAPAKPMHNHWGVRVMTTAEVDKAYEYLTAHKQQYKLGAIGKPTWSHGSYSCYFVEPGTNGWEIECYEDFSRKEAEERQLEINSKHEIRNSKQIQMTKRTENSKRALLMPWFQFGHLTLVWFHRLFRISIFGFRTFLLGIIGAKSC